MGNVYSKFISKVLPAFLAVVLVLVSTIVLVEISNPSANAAMTGECGSDRTSLSSFVATNKVVSWASKNWVLIGVNNGSDHSGLQGPAGTVTLLLDKSNADNTATPYTNGAAPYAYSGSDLQSRMNTLYNALSSSDKANVVPRTLLGGSEGNERRPDFNPDLVTGPDAADQGYWPLSMAEAVQLEATARTYKGGSTDWWTRTIVSADNRAVLTVQDGIAGDTSRGGFLNQDSATSVTTTGRVYARPAVYVNASAVSYSGKVTATCDLTPTVNVEGKTWDIVSVRKPGSSAAEGSTEFGQPQGAAVLVLSKRSAQRYPYNDGGDDVRGVWASGNSNDYASSALKTQFDRIQNTFVDPNIVYRSLPSSTNNTAVANQQIWPLSSDEYQSLDYETRIYSTIHFWLRTKSSASTCAYALLGALKSTDTCTGVGQTSIRPAMFYLLTQDVQNAWDNRNSSWNDTVTPAPTKPFVTASCFNYTAPALTNGKLEYDRTAHSATVTNNGSCNQGGGIGALTVYYKKKGAVDSTRTSTAPTVGGDWVVSVDTAETNDYARGYNIVLGEFTIAKRTLTPRLGWIPYFDKCDYSQGSPADNCSTIYEKDFDGSRVASFDNNKIIAPRYIIISPFDSSSGLLSGDTLNLYKGTDNAVSWGADQGYGWDAGAARLTTASSDFGDQSSGCIAAAVENSSNPWLNLDTSNAGDNKNLLFPFQLSTSSSCSDFWDSYQIAGTVIDANRNVYGVNLAGAANVYKSSNTISVTANNITIKRGDTLPTGAELTAKVTGGRVSGDNDPADPYTKFTGEMSLSAGCSSNTTGTCQIIRNTLAPINYSGMNFTAGTLTIVDGTAQGDLEVADAGSKTYGATNFNLGLTAGKTGSGTGAVTYACTSGCTAGAGQVAEVTSAGVVTIKGAGTLIVTATKAGDATYSAKTSSARSITVGKKSASVTAGAVTVSAKTYDGTTNATISNGSVSASSITGRINSDDITATCTTAAFADANAGTGKTVNITGCTIGGTKAGNYDLATSTTSLATINKANQATFALDAVTGKTYGDTAFALSTATNPGTEGTLSYECVANCATSGTAETVTLNTSTGQVTINKAGTGVKVKAKRTPASTSNYNEVTSADLTFDVAKKNVTVNANDVTVNVNANLPTLSTSNVAVPSGLVGTDTVADVVSGAPAYGSSAQAGTTGSGTCVTTAVNATGISDCIVQGTIAAKTGGNYSITWGTNGKLKVISKQSQPSTFVLNDISNKTYGDAAFTVSSTGAQDSATISFSVVSGPATISNTTLSINGSGTVTVRACAAETANYAQTCATDKSFTVAKRTTNVTGLTATNRDYVAGSTAVTIVTTGAAFSDKVTGDTITLSSCVGNMSDENAGTSKTVSVTGCTLDATSAANYTLGTLNSPTVTINKINQTLSFASSTVSETYTGTGYSYTQSVTATSAPGTGTITYSIETGGTAAASINSSTGALTSFTKAGTITVKASKAADTNYNATSATYTLTLAKANQSALTITNPGTKTYGDAAFTLATTGGSGGSPVFTCGTGCSTTADTATVRLNTSNGQLTIKNAGTAVIKASIAGNDLYNDVNATDLSITVNKADITVTATDKSLMVGTTLPASSTLEFTHSALKYSDTKAGVFSGALSWAAGCTTTTVGEYSNCIEQGNLAVNSNYNITTFNKGKLTVTNKNPQPNTFVLSDISAKTYGDASFNVSASGAQGGGAVTYEITAGDSQFASISGNSVTVIAPTPTGSPVKVRACVAESTTYASGCTAEKSFVINKFTTDVSGITANNRAYDPGNTSVTINTTSATFSKPSTKTSDSLTLENCTGQITSADAGNNKVVTLGSCALGGAAAANYTLGTTSGTGTGTNAGRVLVNITKADQSAITVGDPGTKTYGDAAFTLSATGGTTSGTKTWECGTGCATSGSNEIATLNTSTGQITINKAGVFAVRAKMAGNNNYNDVLSSDKSITIGQFATTVSGITATDRAYASGNTNVSLVTTNATFSRPSGKTASSDPLSLTGCTGSIADASVGMKTVTVTGCTLSGTAASNYTLSTVNSPTVNITGAARTLTATASSTSFDWKGTAPTLSATVSDGAGTITWTCTAGCPGLATVGSDGTISNVTGVGTFKVKANIAADGNWSAVASNELTITTTKANQAALTISSVTGKKYGDTAFNLAATGGTTSGAITWTCTSGCSGQTPIAAVTSGGEVTIKAAGSITVKAVMAGNTNYNDVEATATVSFGKAQLTITADDITVIQGGTLPAASSLTYSVTGLVGSDTKTSALEGSLGFNVGCDTTTIGQFTGCVSQGSLVAKSAGNYEIASFTAGKLIIVNKYPQPNTFVMNSISNKTYGDAAFTVSATGGAGSGALTYEVVSGSATIAGNQLSITGAGTVQVRACKAEDATNASGCTAAESFTVNPFATSVAGITATNRTYAPGDTSVSVSTAMASFTKPTSFTSDDLTMACNATGNMANDSAGNNKAVTLAGCTLGGSAASNYEIGVIGPVTVNITKANQAALTVDISSVPNPLKVNAEGTLGYSGGSGTGTVSYEVVSGSAQIVGNKVIPTAAGTITVKAVKSADNNYLEASSATETISAYDDVKIDDAANGGAGTGVSVRGTNGFDIPADWKLVVVVKDSTLQKADFDAFDDSIGSDDKLHKLYDIHFIDTASNGDIVTSFDPNARFDVVVPGALKDTSTAFKVWHQHDGEDVREHSIDVRRSGTGTDLRFTVNKFSLFGVSYAAPSSVPGDPGSGDGAGNGSDLANTGSSVPEVTLALFALLMVAIACCVRRNMR